MKTFAVGILALILAACSTPEPTSMETANVEEILSFNDTMKKNLPQALVRSQFFRAAVLFSPVCWDIDNAVLVVESDPLYSPIIRVEHFEDDEVQQLQTNYNSQPPVTNIPLISKDMDRSILLDLERPFSGNIFFFWNDSNRCVKFVWQMHDRLLPVILSQHGVSL